MPYCAARLWLQNIDMRFVMDKRPNIILLMADQMRGDCLGIAGHPDVKTPFLDALAAEGVRYENAYSACPTCVPARASLYTGMSQEHTGRIGYEDLVPWNYTHTLAGELSKAGYYTQCVGKMHVHPLRNNLGFNDIRLHDGYLHAYRRPTTPSYEDQRVADDYYWWLKQQLGVDADPVDTGLDCNSWVVRPWIYEEKYHPTNWVASECRDFLRRRDRSKPFFLMASFVRPHPPLDAPEYCTKISRWPNLGAATGTTASAGNATVTVTMPRLHPRMKAIFSSCGRAIMLPSPIWTIKSDA